MPVLSLFLAILFANSSCWIVVPPNLSAVGFFIGMPEMLKPTSLIIGAGLSLDVACLTDGRFSGG